MRQVTHALLTRPPLSHLSVRKLQSASFDLHVLSTPPAFILSQDQTLIFRICFLDFSSPAGLLRKSILYLVFVLLNLFLESFRVGHAVQLSRCFFCRFRDSLFIIAQRNSFVNTFFKLFLKKFSSFSKEKWRISGRAEKEGFEPSRRLPDLHP